MTSKLTREQLHERARENVKALKMASRQHAFESAREEILADLQLAELALAAMDSEPVAVVDIQRGRGDGRKYALCYTSTGHSLPDDVYNLYVVRQPAPERDQVRREHAEWSQATFGNVGPVGPLKHLSKEALEAAAEPDDLSEWADMQFLLWDAQRRAGITDEQIIQAMIEKLAVNKLREWPEPKDGEPRLHIKEQQAPVVQCPFPCGWDNLNRLAIQDAAFVTLALVAGEPATESVRQAAISNNDRLLKVISACRAAMLTGSGGAVLVNDGTIGKPLTIILPDISSKAFWSGAGRTETFHPGTYRRWVREAIERYCAIARIDVEVK